MLINIIKHYKLVLLMLIMVLVAGCRSTHTLNDLVEEDAMKFCLEKGYGDWEFLEDNIRDGKFYCINDNISYNGHIEDYFVGVK